MTKHFLSLGAFLVGAALAFGGTVFLRRHHPMVSPHSPTESTGTFVFWLFVVITCIALPVFVAFRLSQSPFPPVLRGIAWLVFIAVSLYLWRVSRPSLALPYVAGVGCGFLFAADAIRSFRIRLWAIALPAAVAWVPSVGVFLALFSALLYVE